MLSAALHGTGVSTFIVALPFVILLQIVVVVFFQKLDVVWTALSVHLEIEQFVLRLFALSLRKHPGS